VNLFRDLSQLPEQFRHCALSIGNFDGVHRGHARIVQRLLAAARAVGGPAVVFTFDPHPARLLHPERAPAPLGWTDRKVRLLRELGADAVIVYPTDLAFLQLEAREFFNRIVRERLAARAMVEGPNFFFGHNRTGTVDALRQFCAEAGVALEVVEPIRVDGANVSSSRIRALVAEGRVDQAHAMLGRPYRIHGEVIRGAGRGRTLGYPTANVGRTDTLLPSEGIYAGRAWVDDSPWPAAISIGPNPTFDETALKVEVYLIEFEGDLYEKVIEVDFLTQLRKIKRFRSAEQLTTQMNRDIATARDVCRRFELPSQ